MMTMKAAIPGVKPEPPALAPWKHPNATQMDYLNTWLRFLSTRKIPYKVWRAAGKRRNAAVRTAKAEALAIVMRDPVLLRMLNAWAAKRKEVLAKPCAVKNPNIAKRLVAAHIREVMWDAASDVMLALLAYNEAGLVMVLPLAHVELLVDEGNAAAMLCLRLRRVAMP